MRTSLALPDTRQTIAITHVDHILQGARRQGLDVPAILLLAGLSPALLASPLSRVSQRQYAALIRVLKRITRDELWGLCNRPVPIGTFSECCRLLIHAPHLGAALRTGFRYYHRVLADFVARLQVERGVAHVRVFTRGEADERLDYAERVFMFFTFGLGSWLVARRIPVLQVNYQGPVPPHASDASRIFDAPLRYEQHHVGFSFDARWLELPVVQNTQSLDEFLRQAPANLIVRYRDRTSPYRTHPPAAAWPPARRDADAGGGRPDAGDARRDTAPPVAPGRPGLAGAEGRPAA